MTTQHDTATGISATRPTWLAVVVWSLAALAFGYAFFQRVAPSVMVPDLMAEFAVSGAVLGQLSALYFYPYAALQLPIGALLDRYGARALLTLALTGAAAGSLLFGLAQSVPEAYAGRFMIGAGSSVGFISSMALAAKWFEPKHFAFLAGLAMLFAMLCGMAGQAPLALAVDSFGWRASMVWAGVFGLMLAVAVFAIVRNAPAGMHRAEDGSATETDWHSIGQGLATIIRRNEIWRLGVTAMSMSGPMLAIGGLWGVPFMAEAYGLERAEAALYTSLTLLGWAVGAPMGGWLSDRIRRRKAPLVAGTIINTGLLAIIAFVPGIGLAGMAAILFLTGVSGGSMVITFALAREVTRPGLHGSVSGLINGLTVAAGAVLQPILGWVLDHLWDGTMAAGARVYQAQDYRVAFICLVVWAGAGALCALSLRETRCRPIHDGEVRAATA